MSYRREFLLQAIQVRYFSPGYKRGSRIKAFSHGASITIGMPIEMNMQQAAIHIATKLAAKLNWRGIYFGGVLKNGDYVFVHDNAPSFVIEPANDSRT